MDKHFNFDEYDQENLYDDHRLVLIWCQASTY